MLDKHFDFGTIETQLYQQWEKAGIFKANPDKNKEAFSIVIPPPNVTGSLHMGHAFNNTLQDILVRFERMRGKDVLWQAGTDHAGIATQMVVERMLDAEGKKRLDMGREAFLERVWQWKAESGGTITSQLRRLGASCDWSRERFTMDEGLSKAVLKVFVELYKQGLIYKDKRLVNWDPKLLTAVSDIEAIPTEIKGNLWHFRYPIDGMEDTFIVVATTRPETMLGDTAVAVNPNDERYQQLIGKFVRLPIVDRLIPIVGDDYADPETGSGAVKITPAHDFNDFEVGKRHNLEAISILDIYGKINENAPVDYQGLDRFEARKKIVQAFEEMGLLEKIEPHTHKVPHGERSGVIIEPFLTEQWYVRADILAKEAVEAVEDGRMKFVPANWDKTYYEWMRNIQPWCISRQLWWGHQIPAWYAPDGSVFVAETEEEAYAQARTALGADVTLTRDEDVLDTWFSSGLWAFATLGWPENDEFLDRYYPTSVLITGFDIIFFWVARMMMMGMHFMKKIPFHTVYMHALVRDAKGQKMSKSKGNVIDPLETVEKYGADALRFTLCAMAAAGRDIKLSDQRIEGYRNFGTKLWNATRFAEMNECVRTADFDPARLNHSLNQWIVSSLNEAIKEVTLALETFRFNDAATALYKFTWNVLCDWYVELAKPLFASDDTAVQTETRATVAWVLEQVYTLLHPFMPFITETLWQNLPRQQGVSKPDWVMQSAWPVFDVPASYALARTEMDWVIESISTIRASRAEMNVPAGSKIDAVVLTANTAEQAYITTHKAMIMRLARLENLTLLPESRPNGTLELVIGQTVWGLVLGHIIDFNAEKERVSKEVAEIEKDVATVESRLNNQGFMAKAKEEVIDEFKERLEVNGQRLEKLKDVLSRLQKAS